MGQKSFRYMGNGPLRVELDIVIDDKPAVDKCLFEVVELKDSKGDVKCTPWTIAAEDLEDNNDYTDLVVNVIATDKA